MKKNLLYTAEVNGANEKMFVELFSIDSDFSENEEYFRKDTLELGFKNEAERCSKELYDNYFSGDVDVSTETLSEAVDDAMNYFFEGTTFIAGNSGYSKGYDFSILCTDDSSNEYTVVVTYIGY